MKPKYDDCSICIQSELYRLNNQTCLSLFKSNCLLCICFIDFDLTPFELTAYAVARTAYTHSRFFFFCRGVMSKSKDYGAILAIARKRQTS